MNTEDSRPAVVGQVEPLVTQRPTPGPWTCDCSDIRADTWTVYGREDGRYLVAEVSNVNQFPENAANARLIQAAHEMFDALLAIAPYIPTTSAAEGGAARFSSNVAAADKVRAAIARVLGAV